MERACVFLVCSGILRGCSISPKGNSMRRSDIAKALETIPDKALLGAGASELTAKQRRFAREVAKGATKAEAYRTAYKANPAHATIRTEPYAVASNPRVSREIEAYRVALEAAEYRTPAALRSLVIQSLTETLLDADTPPAVRVQAAKVLGTVTEVAAFTERREVTRIDNSQAAKDKLLNEIKDMLRTVEMPAGADADALLAELAGPDPHRDPPPQIDEPTHHGDVHTIPHTQSQSEGGVEKKSNIAFLADIEDPPVDGTEVKNGG
jgi:hypothetical protein